MFRVCSYVCTWHCFATTLSEGPCIVCSCVNTYYTIVSVDYAKCHDMTRLIYIFHPELSCTMLQNAMHRQADSFTYNCCKYCVNSASHFLVIYRVTNSKAEVHFPEEVMTVTTPPPCTIKIPSVESEWVVIGGVGRGPLVLNNVEQMCVHNFFLWGAHSYNIISSLCLVPTQ